jgi:hypothetical protein
MTTVPFGNNVGNVVAVTALQMKIPESCLLIADVVDGGRCVIVEYIQNGMIVVAKKHENWVFNQQGLVIRTTSLE